MQPHPQPAHDEFWERLRALPIQVQKQADIAYQHFKKDHITPVCNLSASLPNGKSILPALAEIIAPLAEW
jgi:hypothetical protein